MPAGSDPSPARSRATVAGRAATWLRRRDPGLRVVRRAGRVTVASCVGFYVCQYLIGSPTTATYAIFGTIALGVLAQLSGTPAQRTRALLWAYAAGMVLCTLGTVLAVTTVAAVVGMLVVGFAVAFCSALGPRPAGLANGLQLFYVLPCFPPYALDTLSERLVGITIGVALLAVADRVLWPEPSPADFAERIAVVSGQIARYAVALRATMRPDAGQDAVDRTRLDALGDAAAHAAEGLRLDTLPVAERPTGPGVRDRSLIHTAAAVRIVAGRLLAFAGLVIRREVPEPSPATADLVGAVGDALESVQDAVHGTGPPPSPEAVDDAVDAYVQRRVTRLGSGQIGPQPRALRAGVTAAAVASATHAMVLAARGMLRLPPPDADNLPPSLWYLRASRTQLWWRRLRSHLTPRSVYLQNAVRLAVGLAAARTVAGVFELTHGFWVLLATLSLMRTSAAASRAALVPAFLGTIVGAVVAGGLLAVIGGDDAVYAWTMPIVMIVAFAAGPLVGVWAAQAGFTLVVALLFAQVAPSSWLLAEARLVDVVVGGIVGAVIGAAVWPRGGGGEIRRVASSGLVAGADQIVAAVRHLAGAGPISDPARLDKLATLFDTTYAQYRTEPPGRPPPKDWLVVLGVLHGMVGYTRTLRSRHPEADPLPWPDVAARLTDAAGEVAQAYRAVAAAVARDDPPPSGAAAALHRRFTTDPPVAEFGDAPEPALRVFDAWGWLLGLVDDLARVERALDTRPSPGPEAARGATQGSRAEPAP